MRDGHWYGCLRVSIWETPSHRWWRTMACQMRYWLLAGHCTEAVTEMVRKNIHIRNQQHANKSHESAAIGNWVLLRHRHYPGRECSRKKNINIKHKQEHKHDHGPWSCKYAQAQAQTPNTKLNQTPNSKHETGNTNTRHQPRSTQRQAAATADCKSSVANSSI